MNKRKKAMATLRLIRDSGYADLVPSYSVLLDGVEIGRLKNAEARYLRISPGNHTPRIQIDS